MLVFSGRAGAGRLDPAQRLAELALSAKDKATLKALLRRVLMLLEG